MDQKVKHENSIHILFPDMPVADILFDLYIVFPGLPFVFLHVLRLGSQLKAHMKEQAKVQGYF
jgi:hypothetical protein